MNAISSKKDVKYLIEKFKSRLSQYDCSQISPCDFLMEIDTETNL